MTQNLTKHGPKIALFEPDIPQNTAAIIRTCACLGAKLEIIEPCGFRPVSYTHLTLPTSDLV